VEKNIVLNKVVKNKLKKSKFMSVVMVKLNKAKKVYFKTVSIKDMLILMLGLYTTNRIDITISDNKKAIAPESIPKLGIKKNKAAIFTITEIDVKIKKIHSLSLLKSS
jgi:hypothetical protein